MEWYADASFLTSAFGRDSNTTYAVRWLSKNQSLPVLISRLPLLEVETALAAAVQGGELLKEEKNIAMTRLKQALTEGLLRRKEISPHQWFPQAHRISQHASTKCVCRALDVLHVAAADLMKADGILSFDKNQRQLAHGEGLTVAP